MKTIFAVVLAVLIASPVLDRASSSGVGADSSGSHSVTLPLSLDHNRMIVDVEFVRPDGSARAARAWVDTGNEKFMLARPLARDLGFDVSSVIPGTPPVDLAVSAPGLRLGGMDLDVDGVKVQAVWGARVLPGIPAEANLPATALRHSHVVFDYPERRLTVAPPGVLEPRGQGIACRVNGDTGLFMIPAVVDGDTVRMGVDNGSAGTWVSDAIASRWRERQPEWPHAVGAVGSANFFGFPFECDGVLMRVPEITIASMSVRDVAALGLGQWMFDWYSQKSAGPVVGFLGANVLANFRLEVDFPGQMTYWEESAASGPNDLDIVGLTLRPEADGSYTIAAVVTRDSRPMVAGIEPGDKLVRVGTLDVADATMGTVVAALRGAPGSVRELVIERDEKQITLEAEIVHLP